MVSSNHAVHSGLPMHGPSATHPVAGDFEKSSIDGASSEGTLHASHPPHGPRRAASVSPQALQPVHSARAGAPAPTPPRSASPSPVPSTARTSQSTAGPRYHRSKIAFTRARSNASGIHRLSHSMPFDEHHAPLVVAVLRHLPSLAGRRRHAAVVSEGASVLAPEARARRRAIDG